MKKGPKKRHFMNISIVIVFLMVLNNSYVDRLYHFYLESIGEVDLKVSCSQKYFEVIFMYVNHGYKWVQKYFYMVSCC